MAIMPNWSWSAKICMNPTHSIMVAVNGPMDTKAWSQETAYKLSEPMPTGMTTVLMPNVPDKIRPAHIKELAPF